MPVRARVWVNPRIKDLHKLLLPSKGAIEDALVEAGIEFRKQSRRIFSTEGAAGGSGKWAPLSPRYAERKRRTRPGRKILVYDGVLRSSLTREGREYVQRAYRVGGRWVLSWGTRNPVAQYHEEGTPVMPRRSPIERSPRQGRRMISAIQRGFKPHIARGIRALQAAGKI